jgi:hypothetical protein
MHVRCGLKAVTLAGAQFLIFVQWDQNLSRLFRGPWLISALAEPLCRTFYGILA